MEQVYSMDLNTIPDIHTLPIIFMLNLPENALLKILIHLLLWIRMNKSSTFKAIKVCCSLITPFTSFITVFLKIQDLLLIFQKFVHMKIQIHVKLA